MLNKSQIMCRGRYDLCIVEVRSVYDILVVGSEGKRLLWIQTGKEQSVWTKLAEIAG
jgi:hypothetical protein